jgi:MoaA/NifB/PqqE/SkfB family radical SAM enzyme
MSDTHCVLPFNHMNLHPNGNVSICCVAKMFGEDSGFSKDESGRILNIRDTDITDIFNSYSYNKVRQEMLDNKRPTPCEGCYKIEDGGGVSRRNAENRRWNYLDTSRLEFLDLRMSNLCNLRCLMCYPDSSSALAPDYKKWSEKLPFMTKNSSDHDLFQWFNEDTIEQILKHKDSLEYLYINGGEPFIMPMHWKFLERLIEEGVAKNIHISYNTNGTTYNENFSDYWKHFKDVTLGISIDGVKDQNKFIRYPSDWDTLTTNIRNLIDNPYITALNLTHTIQWLNAPFIPEFLEWAVPFIGDSPKTTINQNFVVFPHYMSLNCAPLDFKQKLRVKYQQSKYSNLILTKTMKSYLRTIPTDLNLWSQGTQYLDVVQDYRKMGNWREIFNYEY